MISEIKWEFKKFIYAWKYIMILMIAVIGTAFVVPRSKFDIILSLTLGVACMSMLFLQMYNMMLFLREPGFILEKKRGTSYYIRISAKLIVNACISTLYLLCSYIGTLVLMPVDDTSYVGPVFELSIPLPQAWFEMTILYPLVFLCIYYWIGKRTKCSRGALSGFLCFMACGLVSRLEMDLWAILAIEVIISLILFYFLEKWLKDAKEPYRCR